ncbi:hypothetical protein TNIN_388531 [Trichonephila inaurata madagascariensis]|uniref:Uncharacterized protein n=1 Tax=Trichonephila inaurata madagascariensis TaxID=2747483 RepID=A0A8X6I834_9ARAC|nr:hypothetical protein TNIN_388531 [Trichonephila inaurata madagascariensis]
MEKEERRKRGKKKKEKKNCQEAKIGFIISFFSLIHSRLLVESRSFDPRLKNRFFPISIRRQNRKEHALNAISKALVFKENRSQERGWVGGGGKPCALEGGGKKQGERFSIRTASQFRHFPLRAPIYLDYPNIFFPALHLPPAPKFSCSAFTDGIFDLRIIQTDPGRKLESRTSKIDKPETNTVI